MSNYSEKLKDPQWQKKRLEILSSDRWRCRNCEKGNKTLHVHHLYYEKDRDPWDYPDGALITLCEDCHEEAHSINWQKAFLDLNFTPQRLLQLALSYRFIIEKHKITVQEILDKYSCRAMPETVILPEVDMSDSMEELNDMHNYQRDYKEKYCG